MWYFGLGLLELFTNTIHGLYTQLFTHLIAVVYAYISQLFIANHILLSYIIVKIITYISRVLSTHKYKLIVTIFNGLVTNKIHGLHTHNYKIIMHNIYNYLHILLLLYIHYFDLMIYYYYHLLFLNKFMCMTSIIYRYNYWIRCLYTDYLCGFIQYISSKIQ